MRLRYTGVNLSCSLAALNVFLFLDYLLEQIY